MNDLFILQKAQKKSDCTGLTALRKGRVTVIRQRLKLLPWLLAEMLTLSRRIEINLGNDLGASNTFKI